MGKSWEEMCQELVVDGRPGDVASAALGWEQLLKNLGSVQESLERDIKDLGTVWKGPAYKAFKETRREIAKDVERTDQAMPRRTTASCTRSTTRPTSSAGAQAEFPIPASCVNDISRGPQRPRCRLSAGFFEVSVRSGLSRPGLTRSPACPTGSSTRPRTRPRFTTRPATTTFRHRRARCRVKGSIADSRAPDMQTPGLGGGPGGGGARPGSVPNIGGPGPTGTPLPTTTRSERRRRGVLQKKPGGLCNPLGEGPGIQPLPGLGDPQTAGITPPKVEHGTGAGRCHPVTRRRARRRWGPRWWGPRRRCRSWRWRRRARQRWWPRRRCRRDRRRWLVG